MNFIKASEDFCTLKKECPRRIFAVILRFQRNLAEQPLL